MQVLTVLRQSMKTMMACLPMNFKATTWITQRIPKIILTTTVVRVFKYNGRYIIRDFIN